jgi:hypothetical protein
MDPAERPKRVNEQPPGRNSQPDADRGEEGRRTDQGAGEKFEGDRQQVAARHDTDRDGESQRHRAQRGGLGRGRDVALAIQREPDGQKRGSHGDREPLAFVEDQRHELSSSPDPI